MTEPSPSELWFRAEAEREAGGYDDDWRRRRYHDLMAEQGYLVPGEPEDLPCGWPGRRRDPL
jgi:hypothetical protein